MENVCRDGRGWALSLSHPPAGQCHGNHESPKHTPIHWFDYYLRNPIDLDSQFIQVQYSRIFNR